MTDRNFTTTFSVDQTSMVVFRADSRHRRQQPPSPNESK